MARLWIPVFAAGMIVGCGQKGPLVLPDAPKHKKVMVPSPRSTPSPAPAPGNATPGPTPSGTPATDAPSGQADNPAKP
jgi:predicted small lipoprotein YifL